MTAPRSLARPQRLPGDQATELELSSAGHILDCMNMKRIFLTFAMATALSGCVSTPPEKQAILTGQPGAAVPDTPEEKAAYWLYHNRRDLMNLYRSNGPLVPHLNRYAKGQGFGDPVELKATVIHELIHIDSVTQRGFYLDGKTYLRPYIGDPAWPTLMNREMLDHLTNTERSKMGTIYSEYVRNTPQNSLPNVLDEINAYRHTIPVIAQFEPESLQKQIRNLRGHLALAFAYERVIKTHYPDAFKAMGENAGVRSVIASIIPPTKALLAEYSAE